MAPGRGPLMSNKIFECQKCGKCCEGKGGIVLSQRDLERLAVFTARSLKEFTLEFCELSGGKLKLRCGADGWCCFFSTGSGCNVHEAKPDVCRAWPFFRGNLEDPYSLDMAKSFCPGIGRDASFAEFAAYGRNHVESEGLVSGNGPANALRPAKKAVC